MDRSLMIRRAMMGFRRDAMGVPPFTLIGSKGRGMHSLRIEGNTQRTVTIDGVEYDVPDDVTLLDYVQSSGTQYIDTGIQANPSCTNAKMRVCLTNITGTTAFFGARRTNSASSRSYNIFGNVSGASGRFDNVYPSFPYGFTADTWYDIELGHNGLKGTVTIDGTLCQTGSNSMENAEVGNIYIGSFNNQGTAFSGTPSKWGVVSIWKDGVNLSGVFHPAKQGGTSGMYDFVRGIFIAATGTLTAGNELPTPDFPLGAKGVGDRTENLFDMHYDVGYSGTYPNITEVSGGKSTEWIETDKFPGNYFWIAWNPKTNNSSCIVGLIYSNDKENILERRGIVNSSAQGITPNTDNILGGAGAYAILRAYKYVKAYCVVWSNVNRLGVYATAPSAYIPYGYEVKALLVQNCGCVDMGTLDWVYVQPTGQYIYGFFRSSVSGKKIGNELYLKGHTIGTGVDKSIWGNNYDNSIRMSDSRFTDTAAFKAAMSGKYLYFQRTTDASWVAPTPITIYTDKPLNKVGNYADVIDAIAGLKTDRVGVKVLDGTENWIENGGVPGLFRLALAGSVPQNTVPYVGICTHFAAIDNKTAAAIGDKQCTFQGVMSANGSISIMYLDYAGDLVGFKAFLAAQYAAGTPVTVWYPLASATTGQVTGQSLVLPRGEVIVDSENVVKAGRVGGCYQSQTND